MRENKFQELKISEPIFLRNLVVFPIQGNGNPENGLKINTIDKIIRTKKGVFSELEMPVVDEVVFNNGGDEPVLMLDGEEITGAMQNRIIAVSDLVAAGANQNISVVCVEEKRWDQLGGFRTGNCSYPRIRSLLAQNRDEKKLDTQKMIWNEIDRKLTVTKTKSNTSSMHEIYDNLQDEVDRYLEGFESVNHNTIGIIGCAGGRILGCDVFPNVDIYHMFEKKLIRSYALDAMEFQKKSSAMLGANRFIRALAKELEGIEPKSRVENNRINGKGIVGQVLTYKSQLLHLSAFPVA
ncbi:MAG TPA: DUF6569 family protein [bacterium]